MADGSKTEKATPKRRRDERKRGHVAMSRDVVAVVTLIVMYAILRWMAPIIAQKLSSFMTFCIGELPLFELSQQALWDDLMMQIISLIAVTVGVTAVGISFFSVAATFAQTKMLVSAEALKPKLSKINPIEGFKKLFSLRNVIEAL